MRLDGRSVLHGMSMLDLEVTTPEGNILLVAGQLLEAKIVAPNCGFSSSPACSPGATTLQSKKGNGARAVTTLAPLPSQSHLGWNYALYPPSPSEAGLCCL